MMNELLKLVSRDAPAFFKIHAGEARKLFTGESVQLEGTPTTTKLQLIPSGNHINGAIREFFGDLLEFLSWSGKAAGFLYICRNLDPNGNIQIRSAHPNSTLFRFQENVGKNG